MNKISARILAIFMTVVMIVCSMGFTSFSKECYALFSFRQNTTSYSLPAPSNISMSLSGELSDMTADFSWDAVVDENNADKDILYAINVNGVITTGITENAYSLTGISDATSYNIQFGAYTDERRISWNEDSAINLNGIGLVPVSLDSLDNPASNDNLVKLAWSVPEGSVYHSLALIDNGEVSQDIEIGTTSCNYYASGGTHSLAIRAYSSTYPEVYVDSNTLQTDKITSYITSVHKNFKWRATFIAKTSMYSTYSKKKKISTIKKGTVAEAIDKYPAKVADWEDPTMIKVKLENGKVGWVSYTAVKLKALVKPTSDYSKSTKTAFVKKYSSKTSYLIWVNQYTMRINIFKGKKGNWKLIKTKRCVVGGFRMPLKYGSGYSLAEKASRVYRIDETGREYYFNNARKFHGSGYFHTKCYWVDTGLARNTIGKSPNTRGCIRLYDDDALYIYNMKKGTKVIIY